MVKAYPEKLSTDKMVEFVNKHYVTKKNENITRIEIVSQDKREYVDYDFKGVDDISIQDNGKTMKIFVRKKKTWLKKDSVQKKVQ